MRENLAPNFSVLCASKPSSLWEQLFTRSTDVAEMYINDEIPKDVEQLFRYRRDRDRKIFVLFFLNSF